jgi:hypothetical protein
MYVMECKAGTRSPSRVLVMYKRTCVIFLVLPTGSCTKRNCVRYVRNKRLAQLVGLHDSIRHKFDSCFHHIIFRASQYFSRLDRRSVKLVFSLNQRSNRGSAGFHRITWLNGPVRLIERRRHRFRLFPVQPAVRSGF